MSDSGSSQYQAAPAHAGAAGRAPGPDGPNEPLPIDVSESSVVPIDVGAGPISPDDHTVISAQPLLAAPRMLGGVSPLDLGTRLEGERLGHFDLIEFIGGGGMGAVYRATDTMLNRTVAVKVLTSGQPGDDETERRFRNEAQSAARLDHQHIARVYYVGEDRGVHYIVFEYVEGVNVRDLVDQRGPLPLADAVNITIQIADALAHASQRDVVHRDIKPSNVILTARGETKLVDMGLARLHQVEHTDNDLTASGVTLGTFDYISPEQARDPRTADVRSDLYSLGCTLFFMLSARPPFPNGTVLQKLLQHQGDEPPEITSLRSDVPADLSRILHRLLVKSPQKRYQTPEELIVELIAFADKQGLPRTSSGRALALLLDDMPRRRRWVDHPLAPHLPWLAPVILLIVAVFVIDRIWPTTAEPITFAPIRSAASDPALPAPVGPVPPRETSGGEKPQGGSPLNSGDPGGGASSELPPAGAAALTTDAHAIRSRLGLENAGGLGEESSAVAIGPAGDGFALTADSAPATTEAELRGDAQIEANDAPGPLPVEGEPRSGVLIVTPGADAPAFHSLSAACAAAESGDIIELRFDGRLVERPLRLARSRLTIRAGEGFHPQIVFAPGPDELDPFKYPRSMFLVGAGELTLLGLHLELVVPQESSTESWSLFQSRGADSLRLQQCWLTIKNSADGLLTYHQQATFFDVHLSPGGSAMPLRDSTGPEPRVRPLSIRMNDCIARGDATLLRTLPSQDVELVWENGLLATGERLLDFKMPVRPEAPRGDVRIELRHLTCFVGQGLFRTVSTSDVPQLSPVRMKCGDSILATRSDSVLVEQRGLEDLEQAKLDFTWSGDRNFYEGPTVFWRLTPASAGDASEELDFEGWVQYWSNSESGAEDHSQHNVVIWRDAPAADRAWHSMRPADFALDTENSENPAHGAASSGQDAGMILDALPAAAAGQSAAESTDPAPAKAPALDSGLSPDEGST